MDISDRLKEERQRLGLSQTAFAAIAGVTKSAQIKWESGSSSAPTAPALAAFAEAGADVLYILTGRRTLDRPATASSQIVEQLAETRREILDPARYRLPDEDEHRADARLLEENANSLKALLRFDRALMTPEMIEEAEHLLDIVQNPASLSLVRAADRVQLRKKRDDIRRGLWEWLEGGGYEPDDAVTYMLTTLAMEYGAPVKFLTEVVYEMHRDISEKLSAGTAKS